MKCFVVLAGFLAVAVAINDQTGVSQQTRSQDLKGYAFGYQEAHPSGGSSRQEKGDVWGNKVGSYTIKDADGRVRRVDYVADKLGFRAKISTNEPGTQSSQPAAALVSSSAPLGAKVLAAPSVLGHGAVLGAPIGHGGAILGGSVLGGAVLGGPVLGGQVLGGQVLAGPGILGHGGVLGAPLGLGLGGLGAYGGY